MINEYIKTALTGSNDSDRHLMVLFSIALATKGKNFIELGVRSGTTTGPLKMAAQLNNGKLYSVDIDKNPFNSSKENISLKCKLKTINESFSKPKYYDRY